MTTAQELAAHAASARQLTSGIAAAALDVSTMEKQRDSLEQQLDAAVAQREELRADLHELEALLGQAQRRITELESHEEGTA